jgi:hypothetical protein
LLSLAGGSPHSFRYLTDLVHLTRALSRRQPQLADQQRQVDAELLGRFNAAARRRIPQSILSPR